MYRYFLYSTIILKLFLPGYTNIITVFYYYKCLKSLHHKYESILSLEFVYMHTSKICALIKGNNLKDKET